MLGCRELTIAEDDDAPRPKLFMTNFNKPKFELTL